MLSDLAIFNFINGFAGQSALLDKTGIFLADLLPVLLVIALLALFFWPAQRAKEHKIMVLVALATGIIARFGVKTVIVLFWHRPRPFLALPGVHKLILTFPFENFQSFPSGHAIFFFAVSAVVYCFHKRWGTFFFICSVVIGLARIFAGVHWPSDILAGAVLGIITGFMVYWFYTKLFTIYGS